MLLFYNDVITKSRNNNYICKYIHNIYQIIIKNNLVQQYQLILSVDDST